MSVSCADGTSLSRGIMPHYILQDAAVRGFNPVMPSPYIMQASDSMPFLTFLHPYAKGKMCGFQRADGIGAAYAGFIGSCKILFGGLSMYAVQVIIL